jgi:hypothetical protein
MRTDGLCGCVTCDAEYPPRVAFSLLTRMLEDFSTFKPDWPKETRNEACSWPQLEQDVVKYQDPANADQIMKIQRSLDETRDVLHNTIGMHYVIYTFIYIILRAQLVVYNFMCAVGSCACAGFVACCASFPKFRDGISFCWRTYSQTACCSGGRSWRTWWRDPANLAPSPSFSIEKLSEQIVVVPLFNKFVLWTWPQSVVMKNQ